MFNENSSRCPVRQVREYQTSTFKNELDVVYIIFEFIFATSMYYEDTAFLNCVDVLRAVYTGAVPCKIRFDLIFTRKGKGSIAGNVSTIRYLVVHAGKSDYRNKHDYPKQLNIRRAFLLICNHCAALKNEGIFDY